VVQTLDTRYFETEPLLPIAAKDAAAANVKVP
jgi:hypothetical protein